MPKRDQLPAQMVRASAGLHADQAGRKIRKAVLKLTARELRLEDDGAAFIEADQVENVLADIDADDGNLCAGLGGFAVRWHGRPFRFFSALKKQNNKRQQHRTETAYTELRTIPQRKPTANSKASAPAIAWRRIHFTLER